MFPGFPPFHVEGAVIPAIRPVVAFATLTRADVATAMSSRGPDPAFQPSCSFHLKQNCSQITHVGSIKFPVCGECASKIEEELLNAMLLEMSTYAGGDDWTTSVPEMPPNSKTYPLTKECRQCYWR